MVQVRWRKVGGGLNVKEAGKIGGMNRAKSLSKSRRVAIARKAARARWRKAELPKSRDGAGGGK